MSLGTITISCTLKTNIDRAWELYTTSAHIMQWNFASNEWHCPSAKNDLRVGGIFSYRMEAKDGSFGFYLEGTFNLIEEPTRLSYTLNDRRNVDVQFKKEENNVRVDIVFEPETENDIELQRKGWQAILNNFKSYTEDV